jgi:chromosome segregation ATPase
MTADDQAAHNQIDQRATERRDHQSKLEGLRRKVADAEKILINAESFKSHLAKRIEELRQLILSLIGQTRSVANVDPSQSALDSYLSILTMELAIKDFPRVRHHLVEQLDAAKSALKVHEQRAPK